jgi:hypothetical protein
MTICIDIVSNEIQEEDRRYWNREVALDASKYLPRKKVQSHILPQKMEPPINLVYR